MNKSCTENILRVMELSRQLVASADRGDEMRTDSGCGVLFGIARDTGYRILYLAEEEKTRHQRKGTWDILAEHKYTAAGSKKMGG